VSRRGFLTGAVLAVGALSACGGDDGKATATSTTASTANPSTQPTSGTTVTTSAPTTRAAGPAQFVSTGPANEKGANQKRVALTFHTNGDVGLANQLLDIFAARKVHVTTFIVGEWLNANPSFAERIAADGHEFANHTYTHPTFGDLSPAGMTDEVTRCRDELVRLTGSGGRCFRPSGTDDGTSTPSDVVLQVAGAAGYPIVLGFDVDPLDYQDPGSSAVTQRTLDAVKAGSIVSLHFGHAGTVAAMPAILDGLDQRGLTPVTISTLLGLH
jgi:peptidoglycan/xylan/chitin deacetylase (PgdA/CDA1 family)